MWKRKRIVGSVACLLVVGWLAGPRADQPATGNAPAEAVEGDPAEATIRPPDPHTAVEATIERLDRAIDLDEKEIERLRPMLLERQLKINSYIGVELTADEQFEVRKVLYALQRDTEAKMAAILGEEKMQRFLEWKERERERTRVAAGQGPSVQIEHAKPDPN